MTDFRQIHDDGCCTTPCNTVRSCMCAALDDAANEIVRLRSALSKIADGDAHHDGPATFMRIAREAWEK